MVAIICGIFSLAAVAGGGLGGAVSDRWNPSSSVITMIALFFVCIIAMPFGVLFTICCVLASYDHLECAQLGGLTISKQFSYS